MFVPEIVAFNNQRVLTTQQLAEVYETDVNNIQQNFKRNKTRFIEGKHYHILKGENLKTFKNKLTNSQSVKTNSPTLSGLVDKHTPQLILWTEKGADRHCKILDTDNAWEQFDNLEETYFRVKENAKAKALPKSKKGKSLASVNNAVKIMMPLLQNAGCNVQIQLLTARTIYEQAGLSFPFLIKADDEYLECDKIADKLGVCAQSGKPHGKAIAAIVRKLSINEEDYTETWESTSSWQGTVRKYNSKVYEMIKQWLQDNNYPPVITTVNSKGAEVNYKILYRNLHTQGTISPTQPQA